MPDKAPGTIEFLISELASAFSPLEEKFATQNIRRTMASLGLRLPEALTSQADFMSAIGSTITDLATIPNLIIELKAAIDSEDLPAIIIKIEKIGEKTSKIISSAQTISTKLKNISASFPEVDSNIILSFANEFAQKLIDYLIIYHIESFYPLTSHVLEIIGLTSYEAIPGDPIDISKSSNLKKTLKISEIGNLLKSPSEYFKSLYKWGDPAFDGKKIIDLLHKLLMTLGIPLDYERPKLPSDIPSISISLFKLQPTLTGPKKGLELILQTALTKGVEIRFPFLQSNWFFEFLLDADLVAGSSIKFFSDGTISIVPPSGAVSGKLNVNFLSVPPAGKEEFIIIGQAASSRISTKEIRAGITTSFSWNSSTNQAEGNFGVEVSFKGCKIIINTTDGDSFLNKLLPKTNFEADFDLLIGISSDKGFYFSGSSALELRLPAHIELGPVSIEGLTLGIKFKDGKIPIELGADIKGSLGPFVAIVQNMGLRATFSFPPNNTGNLGPLQLDMGFKPPNGVGLSIDAGIIKGGGFLFIDVDKGEYVGAMELDFIGVVSLKAIAIINTKMPDGSKGFSLLIIITAEFPPIQLGFGFTLNAVGGLLGLNRTTKLDVLREGVKTNAIKSILFPQDVIANITRIVSDIKQVFPPFADHFVVGPMAELGWGTPSILTLEIGILLEIPVPRIAILGVIKAVLPDEDLAILRIQVNFLGVIDFQNQYISFDASLYDSRLLIYTLSGDMAFRLSWGDNPMFILSVGGFHPAYHDAPQDLQHMTRLTISLLSGDNPRISVQSYFAVTSNTVQFGARAELYAEACGFNVYGFIGYDVLFQFDPFKFIADFSAGLALREGDSVIMGISLSGELSGPTPFNAKGDASIDFFFFSISVSFNETWGDSGNNAEPEKIDITPLLNAEINDDRNWKAEIPEYNNLHVSVKKIKLPPDKIVIHPFGILTFSQRLVPLDINIGKFGNKVPKDVNRFEIKESDPGVTTNIAKEQFAPANFFDKSDNEKLSSPSFELMNSGFKVTGSTDLKMPIGISKDVDYELTYLHKKQSLLIRAGLYKFAKTMFKSNLKASAASQSKLSFANNKISSNAPESVEVPKEQFAIANMSDMKLHSPALVAGSYTEAKQQYEELINKYPEKKDQVQILSHYELNMN